MTAPERPSTAAIASAARMILRTGRSFETRIRGSSMGSAIRDGDRIRIEAVAAAALLAGDVVAFVRGDEIVAHRLVHRVRSARRPERLMTLGDGNYFPDDAFDPDALLGRIAAVDAGDGWRDVPSGAARPLRVRLGSRLLTWIALAFLPLRDLFRRART
jgi:hypothetical protein